MLLSLVKKRAKRERLLSIAYRTTGGTRKLYHRRGHRWTEENHMAGYVKDVFNVKRVGLNTSNTFNTYPQEVKG